MKMSGPNSHDLSTAMTVVSANMEGLTTSNAPMLSEMWERAPHLARLKITGVTLVAERSHIKYGSAILTRSDLKMKDVSAWEQDNIEPISIEMHVVVLHSVYKPQNEKFVLPAPHIVIGDFNSHSTTWGYTTTDDNGEAVEQWVDSCKHTLTHNAKLSKLINNERWKQGYNPDLIFVSEIIANRCGKSVMEPIPHTQHRPINLRADPVVVAHPTPFRTRFNLREANCNGYSAALDKFIKDVKRIPEKYGGFVENVRVVSRRYIPGGCRTNYIPGLSEESKSMYEV